MSSVSADFGGNKGKTPYSQTCGPNAWVTGFYGAVGGWPEGMGISCSDGTTKWAGGSTAWGILPTGNSVSKVACSDGYSSAAVSTGSYVDSLSPTCGTEVQRWGNSHPSNNPVFTCPTGQVVTGVQGTSDRYINSIGFTCGTKPAPVVAPTPVIVAPVVATGSGTGTGTGNVVGSGTGSGSGSGTGSITSKIDSATNATFWTPMHIGSICSAIICIIATLCFLMRRR